MAVGSNYERAQSPTTSTIKLDSGGERTSQARIVERRARHPERLELLRERGFGRVEHRALVVAPGPALRTQSFQGLEEPSDVAVTVFLEVGDPIAQRAER